MVSRSTSFGPTAGTADTKTTIGSAYTFSKKGKIVAIRVNGYGGVTDKAQNAILILNFKNMSGPFEFAVKSAVNEITVGGGTPTEVVPVDIPYENGEVVTVSLTCSEAQEDCIVSLKFIEATK